MKKTFIFFSLSLSSLVTPTFLSSCSTDNGFYMANYESYINDDLLNGLENNLYSSTINEGSNTLKVNIDNFNFRTYSTNEDLERNFTTNYDVAIPSDYLAAKYANEGKILPLDWSKFNLYKLDKYGNRTNEKIRNAYDALTLFTPHVREELQSYDLTIAFKNDNISEQDQKAGLLNYCVPYFAQDVLMGYNSKTDWGFNGNTDWETIVSKLGEKINNRNVARASVVDDFSTLYSVARLIETNNKTANAGDPIEENFGSTPYTGNLSISEAINTLSKMFNKHSRKNAFLFNSDSNILLNDFAQNGSQAIIAYNGDLLFAMQGGDSYSFSTDQSQFESWLKSRFNGDTFNLRIVRPPKNLTVLDCMVINKERAVKKNHINESYAVIKKICLEGSDESLYDSNNKNKYSDGESPLIVKTDENDEYINGPAMNFDYTNYSSPLLTLNAYILNSSSDENLYKTPKSLKVNTSYIANSDLGSLEDSLSITLKGNGYFTNALSFLKDDQTLTENQYDNYIQALVNVYNITENVNANYVTRSLSDLVKDNIGWAWLDVKNNL